MPTSLSRVADCVLPYQVRLMGAASKIEYLIDKYELDYGMAMFNVFSERQIQIQNTGTVRFDYYINCDSIVEPMLIQVSPSNGKIAAGDKATISVKLLAGTAEKLTGSIQVFIAHFGTRVLVHAHTNTQTHTRFCRARADHAERAGDCAAAAANAAKAAARAV